jgi:pseudomonalisin
MQRVLALALGAGLLAACSGNGGQHLLPGAAAAGHGARTQDVVVAPPGWAATATQGATIANGTDKGTLDPATPLTVRLGLNLHNEDQLKALIAAKQRISPAQFAAQFGPTQSEVGSVVSYLQGQGFHNVVAQGQLVSANGTAALAAKAFGTALESFSLGGQNVYANTKPAFVPAALSGVVSAVLGLNNAAKFTVHPRATTHAVSCLATATPTGQCAPSFNAADVQSYYDVGSTATGAQTVVAVMAEGDVSQVISDLRYAENKQGLPAVPARVITVGLPSTTPRAWSNGISTARARPAWRSPSPRSTSTPPPR